MSQDNAAVALNEAGLPESGYTPVLSSNGMSYRPFLELGEGGMAKVYLARAKGSSGFTKLVVLKSMRESDLDDEAIRHMFVDEARLSARFNHPNLVQVQEVSLNVEPPFLVMEYLDGKPLSALRSNERVTVGMRLAILSEVLTGLEYAHTLCDYDGAPLGIVHRDVSPHNVFVTYDGSVKVLDFGIAKVVTNDSRTQAGEVKGKLAYMAPEQLMGGDVDRRADVFSVGSMLWEAAIGRRMWEGLSEAQLMHRLANGNIPRPGQFGQVDPELEEIIVKATANEVSERFASAYELQQELDRYRARAGEHSSIREIGEVLADDYQSERQQNAELIRAGLENSLPPPAFDTESAGTSARSQVRPTSQTPWLVVAAILLIALVGVVTQKWLLREPPPPVAAPVVVPRAVVPAITTSAAVETASPSAEPAAEGTVTSSKPRASKAPSRGVAPAPRAVEAAPPAAAEDRCRPPYYFVRGIKTYKPECL